LSLSFYHGGTENRKPVKACGHAIYMM